jgi:organic hydroperoxide reductase OsmC/OhrA
VATRYEVAARSTDVFGRVLCSSRQQHFVVDGPVQNGCPGEALTPAEAFLAGIAACAVELIHVFAREEELPLRTVQAAIEGDLDRDNPVRHDVTVFNRVSVRIQLEGVDGGQADRLVERFKGR